MDQQDEPGPTHPLLAVALGGSLVIVAACSRIESRAVATPAPVNPPMVVCHLDEHMPGCAEPWAVTAFGLFRGGTVHTAAHRTGDNDLDLTIVTRTVDASIHCTIHIHGEAAGPTASAEIAEHYPDGATSPTAYSGDIRLACFPFPKGAEVGCEVTLMRPGSAPLALYQAWVHATVE